jgi:hypothetical protein
MDTMRNIGLGFLLLASLASSFAQVTRLTANTSDDVDPKLLRDRQGRVWCFWLSSQDTTPSVRRVFYSRLTNGAWSSPARVPGTDNFWRFSFDVDVDTNNIIWLARPVGNTVTIFKKEPNDIFNLRAVHFDSMIFSHNYLTVSLAAIDSNRIWIDYSQELFYYGARWLFMYDGKSFVSKLMSTAFTEYRTTPAKAFKSARSQVNFLRFGTADSHGSIESPYLEVLSVTSADFFHVSAANYSSQEGQAGLAQDTLLYFFAWANQANRLVPQADIVNINTGTRLKGFVGLDLIPEAVSNDGPILAMAWIQDNIIYLKGISGTTFLRSEPFLSHGLINDTSRSSISILADTNRYVWIAWQGMLDAHKEIFVARTQISSELDTSIIVSVAQIKGGAASQRAAFNLSQNYPNPFNPSTTIRFNLPVSSVVSLKIFDALGRQLSVLVSEALPAGEHIRQWNAERQSSGVYFYRLQAGNFVEIKKLVLLR